MRILAASAREVFTAYEKNFGADVTTRAWDTVRKCAAAWRSIW